MTWKYGTSTGAVVTKDLTVTAAKHKIHLTGLGHGNGHDCYFGWKDSTGTLLDFTLIDNFDSANNGGFSPPYGCHVICKSGGTEIDVTFIKTDGINFSVDEVVTCAITPTPWAPTNPTYFSRLVLELVD